MKTAIVKSMKVLEWRQGLISFIKERLLSPMDWGRNDCLLFSCSGVKAMTGEDPAGWMRGRYNNKIQAMKVLRGHYGLGFFDTFDRVFDEMGFTETDSPEFGDIAFVRLENLDPEAARMTDGVTMVLVWDETTVMAPGKEELAFVSQFEWVKIWKL